MTAEEIILIADRLQRLRWMIVTNLKGMDSPFNGPLLHARTDRESYEAVVEAAHEAHKLMRLAEVSERVVA